MATDPENEYKDVDTSPRITQKETFAHFSNSKIVKSDISPTLPSKDVPLKKSSKPSRIVSLGAAANYGKENVSIFTFIGYSKVRM